MVEHLAIRANDHLKLLCGRSGLYYCLITAIIQRITNPYFNAVQRKSNFVSSKCYAWEIINIKRPMHISTLKVLNFWKFTTYCSLKPLWVRHGGSSAGSYLADPTSPIPSHCASIVETSTLRVNTDHYGAQLGYIRFHHNNLLLYAHQA